jgi:impB/mucB/samB family
MEAMATILHADLDAFYASVEQMLDPSLRGKPVAVGGGVVLAASYEAKAFGVRGGMPGRKARELCPQLIFVSGHFKDYQRLGDAAIRVLGDFTPLVERISIDEAFADVAGTENLFGPPGEIAKAIRHRVRTTGRAILSEDRGRVSRVVIASPRDSLHAYDGPLSGRRVVDRHLVSRPHLAACDAGDPSRSCSDQLIGLNDGYSTGIVTSHDASYFQSHVVSPFNLSLWRSLPPQIFIPGVPAGTS